MDHYTTGIVGSSGRLLYLGIALLAIFGNVFGFLQNVPSRSNLNNGDRTVQDIKYLNSYIEDYLNRNHYQGATIGVAQGSRLVFSNGYGTTIRGESMEPTTLLPMSSISKTITAVAVLKLVQEGYIGLTDHVFGTDGVLSSLTAFPSPEAADHRLSRMTIEQLLHHTAGWSQHKPPLYDPLMNSVYLSRGHNVLNISQNMGLVGELTRKDVIRFMMGRKLDHAPGTTYEYSNLGYCILGQIIEDVSQMTYEEFVSKHVLTPLGMWKTKLKQPTDSNPLEAFYSLSFKEGEIPLMGYHQAEGPSLCLIDSSLGWHSTVYDIMRFVTGISEGRFLDKPLQQLLLTPPSSPMFEHQETWPGMGVRVANSGSWWQVADPHDNEFILYHQAFKRAPLARQQGSPDDSLSWFLIMSSNNRKNLRTTFDELLSSMNWPHRNLFLDDCGTSQVVGIANDASDALINFRIPEDQFPAYLHALSRNDFFPTWISTYAFHMETYVSVISARQSKNVKHESYFGLVTAQLKDKVAIHSSQGMQISFMHTYNSLRRQGHVMQAAIFTSTDRALSSGFHKPYEHYMRLIEKHKDQGQAPIVQSIASRHNKQTVSYVFENCSTTNWNSYTNLTLHQLDGVVRANAILDRTLHYLDSYIQEGELLFSAVFLDEGLHTWHFQAALNESELVKAAQTYRRLGYSPKIITGYQNENELNFALLWAKT